ncbi:MAG: thermonuclease family protein [Amphiplicatus sp.]
MRRRFLIGGALAWAAAAAAREVRLVDIILDELVSIPKDAVIEDAMAPDRWNRRVAKVILSDGGTMQERLVASGEARVRPESDDRPFIQRLLALEGEARATRRGLWRAPAFRVFDAADAAPAVGAFNLVEGVVVTAAKRGGRVYLNFGEDYRTDFTAAAKPSAARRWAKAGLDLVALADARLRLRGHVVWINGPSIEIVHPMQVECL